MSNYSKRGWQKRKDDRAGYAEFFQKHISIIKKNKECCSECGERLKGHVSEVAHILPKSYFKSVATNDNNILYLCGMFSTKQCHSKFDDCSLENFKKMKSYIKVSEKFRILEKNIKEKMPYKVHIRFTN